MVSIDAEQDLGTREVFHGVENVGRILETLRKFQVRSTIFATGQVLQNYPALVEGWAEGHEIACHGYYHVPLYRLSVSERQRQLEDFSRLYQKILGNRPRGFRAVQHIIDTAQLGLLERLGFLYDSSVIPSYPAFRKYVGYRGKAPSDPYHPDYGSYREVGPSRIWEIPVTPLVFGIPLDGTWLRVFGPRFFTFLLALRKPRFVQMAMHSWDCVVFKGKYSRSSGERFWGI